MRWATASRGSVNGSGDLVMLQNTNDGYVSSTSSGGGTGDEVFRLRLHLVIFLSRFMLKIFFSRFLYFTAFYIYARKKGMFSSQCRRGVKFSTVCLHHSYVEFVVDVVQSFDGHFTDVCLRYCEMSVEYIYDRNNCRFISINATRGRCEE